MLTLVSMALQKEELETLADLLHRIDNTQITGEVWHALVKKFPTVAIELIVLDKEQRVFLVYRNDREFKGWHYPGSVWNDWETIDERLERLIQREINSESGINISKPYPIGWGAEYKDSSKGSIVTRSTCCLYFVAFLKGEYINQEDRGFFSFSDLPEDMLPFHRHGLTKMQPYLFSLLKLSGVRE